MKYKILNIRYGFLARSVPLRIGMMRARVWSLRAGFPRASAHAAVVLSLLTLAPSPPPPFCFPGPLEVYAHCNSNSNINK